MVLGEFVTESTQYGKQEVTVKALPDRKLKDQLKEAVCHIQGNIEERELEDSELEDAAVSVPADPNVKNFSFTNIEGKVYYRENSKMNLVELPKVTAERVLGMIEIRNITQKLIELQMDGEGTEKIQKVQEELNKAYDSFTSQYGLISSNANRRAFNQDSSYCLLSSLEILDENGELKRKADIFTKRTIKRAEPVTSVDTASEALAVCIGEKAKVDIPFMAQLMDSSEEAVIEELAGVIFKNPLDGKWETSDEYLSGNVREKLRMAEASAEHDPSFQINAEALRRVLPKELDASEIEVRLGAPWIKAEYINRFMAEIFHTPAYRLGKSINVTYAKINGQWNISGKTQDFGNPLITATYGTGRANAYRLLEDALNLKDTKIYDTVMEDGVEKRILNKKETMLVQQKQEMIKSAFKDWIFKDIRHREDICRTYNELFNSTRPREYDGSHIQFAGMTPEITLMPHQKNAIAHVLYGGKDRSHLLTGILKCPLCGSSMYTNKHAWTNKDGTYKEVYYYICGRNKQERGHHCDYKASLRKTDIEPLVIEAVKELVSDKYFAKEIEKRIGVQTDTTAIDKELANYESKLKEVDLNKARLEREIDNLPVDTRFRERKIHDMTLRLDALYDTIVELEERIEDAKLRKSSIEMETITLDNIYKLMLNFGKLYDIISDEEKKSLITYLIKEIQIYPNGESEQPLKSIEFNFPIYRDGQEVRRLLWEKGNTVETVVLLSQQKPDDTIEIDLDLDELDATTAETKATYEEIKAYVWDKHHLKVSSLYISQVKRKCGLEVGQNYNLSKFENPKVPKCPPEKEAVIMGALKHFQMI